MCLDVISKDCFKDFRVNSRNLKANFESKTKYKIKNDAQKIVSKVDFDLCREDDESCCDHLFIVENDTTHKYIFVELKDSKVLKAVKQITASMDKYKDCLKGKEVHGRIVTTKTHAPSLQTSEYRSLFKRLDGNLITKSQYLEDII